MRRAIPSRRGKKHRRRRKRPKPFIPPILLGQYYFWMRHYHKHIDSPSPPRWTIIYNPLKNTYKVIYYGEYDYYNDQEKEPYSEIIYKLKDLEELARVAGTNKDPYEYDISDLIIHEVRMHQFFQSDCFSERFLTKEVLEYLIPYYRLVSKLGTTYSSYTVENSYLDKTFKGLSQPLVTFL